MLTYLKLGLGIALAAAIAWGAYADYAAGRKAGQDAVQTAWDKDKAQIQAVADAAIAAATKERDAALTANKGIQNDYQAKLSAANANAAGFAQRLRNAESLIAAGGSSVPKTGGGQPTAGPSSPSSADQLGSLVTLVTQLRTECSANSDQLDALIAEVKPWLGDAAPVR